MQLRNFETASLQQIADATGIDRTRWCRYIKGTRAMTTRTIAKAAVRLGVDSGDLLKAIERRRERLRREGLEQMQEQAS